MTAHSNEPTFAGLQPAHDLLVAGSDPWSVLAAAAEAFAGSAAELQGLSASRFTDGDCALSFRVAGISPSEAGRVADALAARPDVRLSRIEHIVWKARP